MLTERFELGSHSGKISGETRLRAGLGFAGEMMLACHRPNGPRLLWWRQRAGDVRAPLMITLRKSTERHHVRRTRRQEWIGFHAGRSGDVFALGFGALERFDEHRLDPRASVLVHPARGAEVISYVLAGVIACRDTARRTAILRPGDFQRVSGGDASGLRQTNTSHRHSAQVLQLWLRHGVRGQPPDPERRLFSSAERRGGLCLIASGDAREDALRIQQGVRIYSALLEPDQHILHELAFRRSAWLHVIRGEVCADDVVLRAGDAASFALERAVSFTARQPSEVLLVDLAHLATAPGG